MAPVLTMPEQGLNGPCCRLKREICAIGADGLTVEVHPAPEKAISDGAQPLDVAQFQKMMKDLEPYIQLWQESRKDESVVAASR